MMYKFHIGTIMGSGVIINSVNSVAHYACQTVWARYYQFHVWNFFTLFVLFVTYNAL